MIKLKITAVDGADLRNQLEALLGGVQVTGTTELKIVKADVLEHNLPTEDKPKTRRTKKEIEAEAAKKEAEAEEESIADDSKQNLSFGGPENITLENLRELVGKKGEEAEDGYDAFAARVVGILQEYAAENLTSLEAVYYKVVYDKVNAL